MKKIVLTVVAVLTVALVLAGCGGTTEIKKPLPVEGAQTFKVEGSCQATMNGDVLTVSGTANLMDGTNGTISVLNSNGTRVEQVKFTKQGDSISHDFTMTDEWQGVVYGFISFDTQKADKQPQEVIDAYGNKFQNLVGSEENVIWNLNGVIAIFQSEAVKTGKPEAPVQ